MNGKEKIFSLTGHTAYKSHEKKFGQDIIKPLPRTGPLVDAIGVPQGRLAPAIERSARLANYAKTPLLSMCSHDAKIEEVANFLYGMKEEAPPAWYVIDVPPGYEIPGVKLTAQDAIPPQARKDPSFNLPEKRDALHLLEKMVGSESLFYHDDDLFVSVMALWAVARVARGRHRAGLRNGGKWDRSVNQHAKCDILAYHLPGLWRYSDKGVRSAQPSDNSSVINPQEDNEHSPRFIYNEDTIKAYPSVEARMAGLTREASYIQDSYDPYQPERAAQEEFGDIFADGLYDSKREAGALYSSKYWQIQIEDIRRREYDWLLENLGASRNREYLRYDYYLSGGKVKYSLDPMPEDEQQKRRNALEAGLAINETLTGQDFVNYAYAREEDRKRYSKMLNELPKYKTREEALAHLGLTLYITNVE